MNMSSPDDRPDPLVTRAAGDGAIVDRARPAGRDPRVAAKMGRAGGVRLAIGQNLYDALGAKCVVKRYRSAGAAGGKPFEEQLSAWKQRLGTG
jgi:hypothetical protein